MTGGIISGFPNIQNIKIQYKLDNYKIKVHQKEISSDILLKPSPSFTILRHNTKPLDSKIYSYYITSNLFFPLSFRKHLKPQKIIESEIREKYLPEVEKTVFEKKRKLKTKKDVREFLEEKGLPKNYSDRLRTAYFLIINTSCREKIKDIPFSIIDFLKKKFE